MRKKSNYADDLKADFGIFIAYRLHPLRPTSDTEYMEHEGKLINDLGTYFDNNENKKINVDDVFNIINDFIIYVEYRSYKIGLKDAVHLMVNDKLHS